MLFWLGKYVLLGPLLRLLFRPIVSGREHIPDSGPAILASNHLSFSDSVFLPLMVRRRIVFLAKAEYFKRPGLIGWAWRHFFTAMGSVPIDRSSGSAARSALDTGVRVLGEGSVLGIYPEGTRSPDGRLYRGKTGVARLALTTGVPIIPVAMLNTHLVQPIGRRLPRIMRVRIRIGKPIDVSEHNEMAGDRHVEREITDQIMEQLRKLSGQEYVDIYASKVKSQLQKSKQETATPGE
ncbi:MAG TPA: lysophospholipid acyltransferase family protein [Mycobacteriales bacterium]|nr:lysophospholipid acyltransferase family protein [Mycobacteriales bacterium]